MIGALRERIRNFIEHKKTELMTMLAITVGVFVVYTVINLIIWNSVSISYAVIYAIVAVVLYFVFIRLYRFIISRKKTIAYKEDT